jgi:hypothetical protein
MDFSVKILLAYQFKQVGAQPSPEVTPQVVAAWCS